MRTCAAWLALAALLLVSFPASAAASTAECDGGAAVGAECCDLDCALCACCSHVPKSGLTALPGGLTPVPADALTPSGRTSTLAAWPLDILHVPKPVSA